ncbi:MAG: flippase-like domain-containing protein [Gemmatimonadota bacterium]|nr:MAG: flippase-like domain-containing protein [Gemmatimonadota bacterium]
MKRAITTFLKAAVGISLLVFLLSKTDLSEIWALVKASRFEFLLLAVLAYIASIVVISFRWRLLLYAHHMKVSVHSLVIYYFIGFFVNNFLPTSIGGDIVRTLDLARKSGRRAESAASVLMERVIGLTAIVFLALIGLLLVGRIDYKPRLFLVVFVFLGFLLILFVSIFYDLPLGGLKRWIQEIQFLEFGRRIKKLHGCLKLYRDSKNALGGVFFVSIVYQLMNAVFVYCVSLTLGLGVKFYYFLLFVPLIGLVGFIPISINAVGLREGGYVFLLARIERSSAEALSLALLVYAITLAVSLIGGFFFVVRKESKTLKEAEPVVEMVEESPG